MANNACVESTNRLRGRRQAAVEQCHLGSEKLLMESLFHQIKIQIDKFYRLE